MSSPPAVASDQNGDGGAKIFMSAKFSSSLGDGGGGGNVMCSTSIWKDYSIISMCTILSTITPN